MKFKVIHSQDYVPPNPGQTLPVRQGNWREYSKARFASKDEAWDWFAKGSKGFVGSVNVELEDTVLEGYYPGK